MNKESISYVRHIMGSDFVQLDFINVMISIAIIVVSFVAFATGRIALFGAAFIIGDVLVFFNLIKTIMKKSFTGIVVFGFLLIVLTAVVFYIYKYLA